jgi:threonine dehydrogenase-like Zn-dependent dehydrogenase
MVLVAERKLEHQSFDVPRLGPGEALLRVEATGICGSDSEQINGALARAGWSAYPVIPGHEPVGTIVDITPEAKRLWRCDVGSLVAVESVVPCHVCDNCTQGLVKFCLNRFSYGFTPTTFGCGLWGGYAGYMILRPNSVLHPVPKGIPAEIATLFNPLGAGFDWTIRRAGMVPGDCVVILGSGQRGLACVAAAKIGGAGRIIVTGLSKDRHKLEVARKLGADVCIDVEASPDIVAAVRAATEGRGADRVIDTTPKATGPIVQAVEMVRPGGVIVVAGLKGESRLSDLTADRIVLKALDVRGVVSVGSWGYRQAMEAIARRTIPLDLLHTHTLPLPRALDAIDLLASEAIHVSVAPARAH